MGCYVGPAINHYQSFKYFISKTKTEITTDSAILISHKILSIYLSNYIHQATSDIVTLITCPFKNNLPPLQINNTVKNGFFNYQLFLIAMKSYPPY